MRIAVISIRSDFFVFFFSLLLLLVEQSEGERWRERELVTMNSVHTRKQKRQMNCQTFIQFQRPPHHRSMKIVSKNVKWHFNIWHFALTNQSTLKKAVDAWMHPKWMENSSGITFQLWKDFRFKQMAFYHRTTHSLSIDFELTKITCWNVKMKIQHTNALAEHTFAARRVLTIFFSPNNVMKTNCFKHLLQRILSMAKTIHPSNMLLLGSCCSLRQWKRHR